MFARNINVIETSSAYHRVRAAFAHQPVAKARARRDQIEQHWRISLASAGREPLPIQAANGEDYLTQGFVVAMLKLDARFGTEAVDAAIAKLYGVRLVQVTDYPHIVG